MVSFGGVEAEAEASHVRVREVDGLADPEKKGEGDEEKAIELWGVGAISGGEISG